MKKILLLILALFMLGCFSVFATSCPICNAPATFTGERGHYYSDSWDVYQCSNGHKFNVPTN